MVLFQGTSPNKNGGKKRGSDPFFSLGLGRISGANLLLLVSGRVTYGLSEMPCGYQSSQQNPGYLLYRGDYATQLYIGIWGL